MPNDFAYLVLYLWPLVMVALFHVLSPNKALVLSVLMGYLLLPSQVVIDLPAVPPLHKDSITSLMALLLCIFLVGRRRREVAGPNSRGSLSRLADGMTRGGSTVARRQAATRPKQGILVFWVFVVATLVSPFLTIVQNPEPVIAGPLAIAGLRMYDGLSMSINLFIALIPFFLGLRFLRDRDDHDLLLRALGMAGVLYAFLVLFEFRMSPRLHIWIYGFFQHNWVQHLRGGGFRPIVFLEHGLAVGLFLATAVVAASGRVRAAARDGLAKGPWVIGTVWIMLALLLSRNLAAVALVLIFLPVVQFLGVRKQMVVAAIVAVTFLTFPLLRGSGLVPVEAIANVAATIDERRAESLRFRFYHEDSLLDRAQQKPLFGWGGWGRNRVYDAETGRELSVTDGAWVIVIGIYGWVGYISQFGLMALPPLLLWRQHRRRPESIDPATAALAMVMALSLLYLIPNDFRNPIFWLVAGALAGRYQAALADNPGPALRRSLGDGGRRPIR